MKIVGYVLIAVAVGALLYVGIAYSQYNTQTSTNSSDPNGYVAQYGRFNDTVTSITRYTGHTDYTLAPVYAPFDPNYHLVIPDIDVQGSSCALSIGSTVTYTYSDMGTNPGSAMIFVLNPSNCNVDRTGWLST